jgi:tRNA nucleotidyltransferase (CCA-adding enzyme)
MRIILTHEQADFDALASLLGAYLLDPQALPILPRRVNRNVRAFVTLYGSELPFVDPRDLPASPIERVMVVDSQAVVTLRGMTESTPVWVVDHHPLRSDLPKHWVVQVEQVGATTTLLTTGLREHQVPLTPVQATLLLLGIYEDTGSLTYSRTTPRDLTAAAYLLDRGANLSVVASFLNHPLSARQQQLFEKLRQSARYLSIKGHQVVIATADARDNDEELSTLAHKLRDLLEPDGLFLLIETRSGLQAIARSTSDHVDVGAVMAHFGGGGHDRAAAVLVRGRTLESMLEELIAYLEAHIQPAVTVGQIMSRQPQVLAPDTPVAEALARMQRYGYEGYPIVEGDQVLGLLTRRAVDRAISHRLNLPARSLMNAGNYAAQPGDSLEHLQHLMTESGWGQIPVVDSAGVLVGIVTRTDLLKTLAATNNSRRGLPPGAGLARQALQNALDSGHLPKAGESLLRAVADVASEMKMPVYVVGGFVRDLLLGRPVLDYDIVVEGDAIQLARRLSDRFGGDLRAHARFGTAKWYLPVSLHCNHGYMPEFVDLITARTEFYEQPTALPTVETGSIKLDLHRRDFTINTLALRLDGQHFGELHDYWGGYNDLKREMIRVLHSLSFVDDPTRMLRAVRFEQRFGFAIEERTLQLLGEAHSMISRVTGERLRHEIDRILDEPQAGAMLKRLHALGMLEAIHPALTWDAWLEERFSVLPFERQETGWLFTLPELKHLDWTNARRFLAYFLWLVRQTPQDVQDVVERIHYPLNQGGHIARGAALYQRIGELNKLQVSALVSLCGDVPPLALVGVCIAGTLELSPDAFHKSPAAQIQPVADFLLQYRHIHSNFNGEDLRARGLPTGPHYRKILWEIRAAWLDGLVTNNTQEQALFDQLVSEALEAVRRKDAQTSTGKKATGDAH